MVAYSFCILQQTAVLITDCPNFNVSSRNGQSVSQIHKFSESKYIENIKYWRFLTLSEILKLTYLNLWIIYSLTYQWRLGRVLHLFVSPDFIVLFVTLAPSRFKCFTSTLYLFLDLFSEMNACHSLLWRSWTNDTN